VKLKFKREHPGWYVAKHGPFEIEVREYRKNGWMWEVVYTPNVMFRTGKDDWYWTKADAVADVEWFMTDPSGFPAWAEGLE
jgi:hypothetical protein